MKDIGTLPWLVDFLSGVIFSSTEYKPIYQSNLIELPLCSIELRKKGETLKIDKIKTGETFDIYVGNSSSTSKISWLRFSSDESQDRNPTGQWTEWFSWDSPSGDWSHQSKTKFWLFDSPGKKEVSLEIKTGSGQTSTCSAYIEVLPKKWSFAIITDLHIGGKWYPCLMPWGCYDSLDYGDPTWNDDDTGKEYITTTFLKSAIRQINANREKYNIKFLVVDGDLTDSAELSELNMVKKILDDELDSKIPWIPLIGNHDMWPYATDDGETPSKNPPPEKYFDDIFRDQYVKFKQKFPTFEKGPLVVFDSDSLVWRESYFQNFAFDYNDYHFIGLDFNTRLHAPTRGTWAFADLHKFTNGTWDWFTKHLKKYIKEHPDSKEDIILLAHHPLNKGTIVSYMGFEDAELIIMENFLKNYKDNIYAEFAGHTHQNKDYMWWSDIMRIVETDANVESPLVRIVQIDPTKKPGEQVDYSKILGCGITARTTCPVDLEIIDPDGLIISKELNEIPGALYIEEDINGDGSPDDWIGIPERKLGDYQIKVIPEPEATSTDTYTLEVSTLEDSFGYIPTILAENIPIGEAPTEPYIFESKEKKTTQLVYTGDLSGQYSDSINLKAVLKDKDGNPLPNKTITFQIGTQSTSTITDGKGVATAILTLDQIPSEYYFVEASFEGDEDYLPAFISHPFEILKENVLIDVFDKEGFAFDNLTLEAQVLDDDGDTLKKGPYEAQFEVGGEVIGNAQIGENGQTEIDWNVNFIPKELTETYPIIVTFAGNEYYNPTKGEADFTLKSARWLKKDAVSELEAAKTGNRKTDKRIDRIIWFLNQSLNENLWQDASHLVFFDKGRYNKGKELEKLLRLRRPLKKDKLELMKLKGIKSKRPKSGMVVFHYEKVAVRLMMNEIKFKKNPNELKTIFDNVIKKLVKTDFLLAKVSLFEARNTEVQNSKFKKIVEHQTKLAEKELEKAYQELERKRPGKAIMRLSHSWLYSQLAIKFANLE